VYEDRAKRSGRTLDLAFVVADALEPRAETADAVTFLFGGPGTNTTDIAARVIPLTGDLRRRRDLLFLDLRGTGHSGSLDCDVPYPGGIGSRFGSIFPIDHVVACRDRLAQRARLDLYTSNQSMDDLDELRAWLNYGALDLVGGSYGTREVQVFLRRHPDAVRAVILNAVSPLFEPGYVTHARGLQNALDELVADCARDASCSAAYPELEHTVERVLAEVRRSPPWVQAGEERVRLGPGELGYALRGLLYARAAEIPLLLERAAEGEWQPLADYYLQRTNWVSAPGGNAGMHFSVLCAEDIARLDAATVARETVGTFLGDSLIGGYVRVCEQWPHATLEPSFWEPVASSAPTLLLSGSRDPVTPPPSAAAVARHLPNSLHLVVAGGGHGVGGECIGQIQSRFLERASVQGLDTSCLRSVPPTEFVLPQPE
jgi:pimeloyl-ACP methyl ester carboxylesterase